MTNVKYVEMTVEEALQKCNKNAKVLVAVQDLTDEECDVVFVKKRKGEYAEIFQDVKTVISAYDEFINQLNLFTVKQTNFPIISPEGMRKTILLKQIE